jgi:hypothetical protein
MNPLTKSRFRPPTRPQVPGSSSATAEAVRARAYEIYQERSRRGDRGDALSDWMQAERELAGRARAAPPAAASRGEVLMEGDQD